MTKYVPCRVIDSRPQQQAKPAACAIVPRGAKPNPFKHYLTNRYMDHARPSGGLPCHLDLLA